MAFRFKDLMVDVLSGGGGACPTLSVGPADAQCPTLSVDPARAQCPTLSVDPAQITCPTLSVPAQAAGGGTQIYCPTLTIPTPAFAMLTCPTLTVSPAILATTAICGTLTIPAARTGAEDLAALKQQLRQALEQVEARERAAAEAQPGLPKTVEEADDLERRLHEAIEELQEHRKTLQKPAKPAKPAKDRKGRK